MGLETGFAVSPYREISGADGEGEEGGDQARVSPEQE